MSRREAYGWLVHFPRREWCENTWEDVDLIYSTREQAELAVAWWNHESTGDDATVSDAAAVFTVLPPPRDVLGGY